MFNRVLIANRGEIAVRITRTLRSMGITAIAVFSDADQHARHVRFADEAVRIGPAPARESYLDISAVVAAAVASGAEAVHPGYGFLSENADFARACEAAGLGFIGPPAAVIESMGDKISAKNLVAGAGVPVVRGSSRAGMNDAEVVAAVAEVGLPALLKPAAGGGGKGMHVVRSGDDIAAAVATARREAMRSFADDELLVEQYLERPRHIEVQVLADQHGSVIHLGERECSLQRRHQKVIEEAPSPYLDSAARARLGDLAIAVARACGYVGAGTVEFITSAAQPGEFYFLEMNTRLQVEHPVTEMVTGFDLVREQVRIAAGCELDESQKVPQSGHAVEARVYAEDPDSGFLPSAGELLLVVESDELSAGQQIRVDSGVGTGEVVGTNYDPLLAKIIGYGETRDEALRVLRRALSGSVYLGLTTNQEYLLRVLSEPDVLAGRLHTGLLAELEPKVEPGGAGPGGRSESDDLALAAAGLERMRSLGPPEPATGDPWLLADGWRVGEAEWTTTMMQAGALGSVAVATRGTCERAEVRIAGGPILPGRVRVSGSQLQVRVGEQRADFWYAGREGTLWLSRAGRTWRIEEIDRLAADRGTTGGPGIGPVPSPMPGSVIAVHVGVGESVPAGGPLVTVEAMKMEHTLTAPVGAVVSEVLVRVGDQVTMGQILILLGSGPDGPPSTAPAAGAGGGVS